MKGLSPLLLRAGVNYQRRHRWQAFLALVGISMGVAIVLAVDLATSAARASFELSAAQMRGAASHRITAADGKVPTAWYRTLFTTPGHPPMAPVIRAAAQQADSGYRLQLLGLDIFAEGPFRAQLPRAVGAFDLGAWLSDPNLVALSSSAANDLGLATGQELRLQIEGETHALRVGHIYPDTSSATRDLLLMDIATAQRLLKLRGFISHIDLIADAPQATALRASLPPGLRLVDIDQQTESTVGLSAAFELNLTAMGLLALVVGVFLIYNAMSFAVVQRRNLFGRLRAVGTQPHEIFLVVLAEALVLAGVGTLIGLGLGILLGQGLTQLVAQTVNELYYQVSIDALQVSPLSIAKGVGLGLLGTLLATLVPAYQAAATPPVSSLSRSNLEQQTLRWIPVLALCGTGLALAGLTLAFLLPGGLLIGLLGLFLLIIGAVLITPVSIPAFHWLLQRLPLAGVWRLAMRDLKRHISRLGTATAALMIALSAAVSVAIMVESMRGAVSDWLYALLNADLYVAAENFGVGALLPAGLVSRIETLPTVDEMSLYRQRELDLGGRPVTLVAARLAPASRRGFSFIDGRTEAIWSGFDRGGLLVSEPLANRLRLGPGERLSLPTPKGIVAYPIAGVFRDFASEHGRVFMSRADYRRSWDDPALNTLALFSRQHSAHALRLALEQVTSLDDALVFTEAAAIYRGSMAVFDRTFRVTDVLRVLSLGVAFIGILSALMAIQLQRRKEFAVLRALGMTRLQLAWLVLIESVLLGTLAALLAVPTGLLMAWVLTGAIQFKAFGWTMPLTLSAGPQLLNLGLGVLAAALAALYPAWTASRHDPAPHLRED